MILSGITNYCLNEEIKVQMDSNYTKLCTSEMDIDDVASMVNLGNAEILEIEYNDKLILLKVKSNGHIYILQGNQMVEEDTTELSEPEEPSGLESVSFAEDSWETIATIVKSGKAGEYYHVGDEKEVTLDGYTNGSEPAFTVRIANMSTPEECNTEGFSQTACGFVVEFVDIITTSVMNLDGNNYDGWPGSEMYDFINDKIYNALPNELQNIIIETYSISGHGSEDTTNFESVDKLYLLSTKEVWADNLTINTAKDKTRKLDYYESNNVTTSSPSGAIKNYHEKETGWWLRTPLPSTDSHFNLVSYKGGWGNYGAGVNDEYGVAPAFRIG